MNPVAAKWPPTRANRHSGTWFATARRLAGAILLACAAFCVLPARAAPPAAPSQADLCRELKESLEHISPSQPDPQALAPLWKRRSALADPALRTALDDFVAAGYLAAKRRDLYERHIAPHMADRTRLETAARTPCTACGGTGEQESACPRCGGEGHCPACKGAGKRRVKADIYGLKGPVKAHQKPTAEFKDVVCAVCRGKGDCPDCGGSARRKTRCPVCNGGGKIWDATAVNAFAVSAYDTLRVALHAEVFRQSIPQSIATIVTERERISAPVFRFGATLVAAVPARTLIDISAFTLYTPDKKPLPCTAILASPNRDLVLLDLGQTSLLPPLPVEADSARLDTGRAVYAYGRRRDNDVETQLDGKIRIVGPLFLETALDTASLAEGAPVVTEDGKLCGFCLYPVATINALGGTSLEQRNGVALRLDNLYPADFVRVPQNALTLRNNALAFARRAIEAATNLLGYADADFALRQNAVSDTIKRLDRAIAMLKGVDRWDIFLMEATARERMDTAAVRARNLEARLNQIAALEAARKEAAAAAAAAPKTAPAPAVLDPQSPPAAPPGDAPESSGDTRVAASEPSPSPATRSTAPAPRADSSVPADDSADDLDADGLLSTINFRKILIIAIIVVIALTVIFILIGVLQDRARRKKLAVPPEIPDFVRDMQRATSRGTPRRP